MFFNLTPLVISGFSQSEVGCLVSSGGKNCCGNGFFVVYTLPLFGSDFCLHFNQDPLMHLCILIMAMSCQGFSAHCCTVDGSVQRMLHLWGGQVLCWHFAAAGSTLFS